MAHGHAMVSGRAQAVMVHVVVGLANALCGTESITGSGTVVIGNRGAAPIEACP